MSSSAEVGPEGKSKVGGRGDGAKKPYQDDPETVAAKRAERARKKAEKAAAAKAGAPGGGQQAVPPQQDPAAAAAKEEERKRQEVAALDALQHFGVRGDEAAKPVDLVDIGANLTKFKPAQVSAQLHRAAVTGVSRVVLTGTSVKESWAAHKLCERWWSDRQGPEGTKPSARIFSTAGVHPHDASSCVDGGDGVVSTEEELRRIYSSPWCVAIGETGLDYDRMFTPREVQLEWFRRQAALAVELQAPLFVHERDVDPDKGEPLGSHEDLCRIMDEVGIQPSRVCVHCFTGSEEQLKDYVRKGYNIGLTGFVGMRKRGAHVREALQNGSLPLERIMVETDSPFMQPDKVYIPKELGISYGKNEPCVVPAVVRAVAECMEVPEQQIAHATTQNALRFFNFEESEKASLGND
ncbi:hypothetical protein CYMTET_5604 [Cymbomonas tetramitiformis]|uniref:TatD related DNase n=1 Tax=Cymbomonas tetramitiformis TaxID=36881 RepID=A0AAE0GZ27_9CHLO|nr:hypothetical protein CYMTET_5604 [Cymbomonas tetramitiformis]